MRSSNHEGVDPERGLMIICICKGISEKDVKRHVEQGVDSWEVFRQLTGCSTQCGKCKTEAQRVFFREREALTE